MPICEGCGASSDNSFQFCPHCGRATLKSQSVEVNIKESIPTNACPICHRDDQSQKVSVIYRHGSHDTTMSIPVTEINSDSEGRTYSTTRHQQVKGLDETKLAQALRPPTKPEAPKPPLWQWYFIGGGVLALGFCAPMCAMLFIRLVPYGDPDSSIFGGLLILSFIIFMILLTLWYSSSNKNYQKNMTNYNSSSLPNWKRAIEQWNLLYFCHRDGVVFIPNQKVSVPLDNMGALIFANIEILKQLRKK